VTALAAVPRTLDLHPNQERVRPQLERLAALARNGDRRAREELAAMGIAWRRSAPEEPKLSLVRDETTPSTPKPEARSSSSSADRRRSLAWLRPTPFEARVLRGLLLACVAALACRYVAWEIATAIGYLR
jgi:hypothetical protein